MNNKQKANSISLEDTFKKDNLSDSDLSKYNIYKCNSENDYGICQIYYGHNVINVRDSEIIKLTEKDQSYFNNNLNSIAILNCDDNSCKRTYGYIKDNDGCYYSISYSGFNNTKLEDENFSIECKENNAIGKITSNGDFCQKANTVIPSAMSYANDNNDFKYYIISEKEGNIFHKKNSEGKSLIISATPNTLIFDGLSTNKGLQLFGNGAMIKVEELQITNNSESLSLYYCDDNGICHSLEGYVTNGGSNYYYVKKDGTGSEQETSNRECTFDSIGKLDNKNKFCLGNENVDFLTADDDTSYYIFKKGDANYSFVRGIKYIFAIENHNYEGIINQIIK